MIARNWILVIINALFYAQFIFIYTLLNNFFIDWNEMKRNNLNTVEHTNGG